MINRRSGLAVSAALVLLTIWGFRLLPWRDYQNYPSNAWNSAKQSISNTLGSSSGSGNNNEKLVAGQQEQPDTSHIRAYFDQVFAAEHPPIFPFTEVREACAAADWDHNEAYLNCVGIQAGMTSIMSQVKVCFKMAIETGSHIVLPRMPLRDSHNLKEFNFLNGDAYMPYDQWYDAEHLREQMSQACPRMRIIHPDELDKAVPVARHFQILCSDAPFYEKIHSYFWVGRPFKTFFNEQFAKHMAEINAAAATNPAPADAGGITVVDIDSEFLLFRITDDPTRRDLRMWTELSHLIRFRDDVRSVISRLMERLPNAANYMGVHYRAENDSIWSSAEHQMSVDLDALDRAWEKFGTFGEQKPPVYLACGDQTQIDNFSKAAAERGWETTHKWKLVEAAGDSEMTAMINDMAFDFQGAIDLGIMVRSRFFIGVTGSAFSSTVGNHRDVTGRYRGSSFDIPDEGARTHLFNDLDAHEYACCL